MREFERVPCKSSRVIFPEAPSHEVKRGIGERLLVRKLERVACEVQQDLLQPVGVPHHHRGNLLVNVTRHLDALVARAHAQQGQGPLDLVRKGEVEAL